MLPVTQVPPHISATISDTLVTMPTALVNLVTDYAAIKDYSQLPASHILFDGSGQVINPWVREALKDAFMSSYCPAGVKTQIMQRLFNPVFAGDDNPIQNELRRIFDEIAAAGYRVMFDGVCLDRLTLIRINWTGISLRGADLTDSELVDINMTGGDLTGLHVRDGSWSLVNLAKANVTGVNLNELVVIDSINLSDVVGLEGWTGKFTVTPVTALPPNDRIEIATTLNGLSASAIDVIADYMGEIEYHLLSRYIIAFDGQGKVTNPHIREAYRDALSSSYCNEQIKSDLMQNLFNPSQATDRERNLLAQEGRKIFDEIAASGYHSIFDEVDLYDVTLQSLNWRGISIDMRSPDARDMLVASGQ